MRQSKQDRSLVKTHMMQAENLALARGYIPSVIDSGSAWILSVWDSGKLVLESTLFYSGTCTNRNFDALGSTVALSTSMPASAVDSLGWSASVIGPSRH